jgi:hypothetical protein
MWIWGTVIARSEATKQSILSLRLDGLLRFARNDGLRTACDWLFEKLNLHGDLIHLD